LQKKIAELGQTLKVTRAEIDQHKKDIEDFRSGGAVKRKRDVEKRTAPAGIAASPSAATAPPGQAPAQALAAEVPIGVAPEAAEGDDAGEKKKKKKKKDKAK